MIDTGTCLELEDMAQWFALRGQQESAAFLRAVKDHLATCKESLQVDEIDAIAWQQTAWSAEGTISFDYRLFAREIERAHGIGESRK